MSEAQRRGQTVRCVRRFATRQQRRPRRKRSDPGLQLESQVGDKGKVFDAQRGQHGYCLRAI